MLIGAFLLINLPREPLLVGLGSFVILFGNMKAPLKHIYYYFTEKKPFLQVMFGRCGGPVRMYPSWIKMIENSLQNVKKIMVAK